MKEIVVLRHGEKAGDELTPEGIEACKDLRKRIGQFSLVLSSETNRASQTAQLLSGKEPRRDSRANIPSFPASARERLLEAQASHPLGIVGGIWQDDVLINCSREAGEKLLELVKETLESLSDNERALIISHDGTMVPLEKLLMDESFETADHSFGALEGIAIDEHLSSRPFS